MRELSNGTRINTVARHGSFYDKIVKILLYDNLLWHVIKVIKYFDLSVAVDFKFSIMNKTLPEATLCYHWL